MCLYVALGFLQRELVPPGQVEDSEALLRVLDNYEWAAQYHAADLQPWLRRINEIIKWLRQNCYVRLYPAAYQHLYTLHGEVLAAYARSFDRMCSARPKYVQFADD